MVFLQNSHMLEGSFLPLLCTGPWLPWGFSVKGTHVFANWYSAREVPGLYFDP